jgi:hypothetical protein
MRRRAAIVAVLLVSLASTVATSHAFTIRGSVKNGTTGATNVSARVVAIQPSAGMQEVASTQASDGKYVLENLPDGAPFLLLRAEFDGVTYNTPVTPDGSTQTIDIEVFEATSSWDGVKIEVPHLAVARQGDALHIQQLFEIKNETSPARTVAGKDGPFTLYLPSDMDSLNECYASAGEMPLKRIPIPTGTKDIYGIDYPIRPGVTRIGVAYSVPYATGSYSVKLRFPHGVAHMMVFAVDSTMQVTSSTHQFANQESVHGMSAYALHNVAANGEVALNFTGGDPAFAGLDVEGEEPAHTPENIRVAPTEDFKFSLFLMITVLLVLATIVSMALRDHKDPLSDPQVLRGHYDLLLSRLARLDDLHAAEAIPSDVYRASREELVGRLGALAMQLRAHGGIHTPDKPTPAESQSKAQ